MQFRYDNAREVQDWCNHKLTLEYLDWELSHAWLRQPNGIVEVDVNDYIVKDVDGNHYAIARGLFDKSYIFADTVME